MHSFDIGYRYWIPHFLHMQKIMMLNSNVNFVVRIP